MNKVRIDVDQFQWKLHRPREYGVKIYSLSLMDSLLTLQHTSNQP
jgi:hypothetical protein